MDPQEDPRLTATWKQTIKVAVSGAAGQISNHLLFMVRKAALQRTMPQLWSTVLCTPGCSCVRRLLTSSNSFIDSFRRPGAKLDTRSTLHGRIIGSVRV